MHSAHTHTHSGVKPIKKSVGIGVTDEIRESRVCQVDLEYRLTTILCDANV